MTTNFANSSVMGQIACILMVFDQPERRRPKILGELLRKMPDCRFVAFFTQAKFRQEFFRALPRNLHHLCTDDAEEFFPRYDHGHLRNPMMAGAPPRCLLLGPMLGTPSSIWVRDSIIPFMHSKSKISLLTKLATDSNEHGIDDDVERAIDRKFDPAFFELDIMDSAWFDIEGGNLLLNPPYVFVGYEQFKKIEELEIKANGGNTGIANMLAKKKLLFVLNGMSNEPYTELIVVGETIPNLKNRGTPEGLFNLTAQEMQNQSTCQVQWWGLKKRKITRNNQGEEQGDAMPLSDSPADTETVASDIYADIAHIDMFMTLAGENKDSKQQVVLLAEVSNVSGLDDKVRSLKEYLDMVGQELTDKGFKVLRFPMPALTNKATGEIYYAVYSNSLVSVYKNKPDENAQVKRVWIPKISCGFKKSSAQYKDLKDAEEKIEKIWKGLDFKVSFIDADFVEDLQYRGALRCQTCELFRINQLFTS